MATLLLSAVGGAIGAGFGGAIFGISGAVIGRTLGALAGNAIDQALLGGNLGISQSNVGQRLEQAGVTSSSEGTPITRLQGRSRLTGQMIWATRFEEQVSVTTNSVSAGRGKNSITTNTTTTTFSYYANFAIGLCEGPVTRFGRIWADGNEIDQSLLTIRTYSGSEVQSADALIVGKEGAANAPAYRGLAYLVFERMPIGDFGNRIPQITVEVIRSVGDLEPLVKGVCVIPAATEFGYDPVEVTEETAAGETISLNCHTTVTTSDWGEAINQLEALAPACTTVMLAVAWFGDDLRAGNCTIRPRVEVAARNTFRAGSATAWTVAGVTRSTAVLVSTSGAGTPAFGGTPSDASVIAAIQDLRARGLEVVLCPFLMMDVPAGNTLPNPYSANAAGVGQAAYPWRGRITCSPAPGFAGTVDKTATAATQIDAFFTATNGYRAFIMAQAALAVAAGGVDAFLIGSELVGLTSVRGLTNSFPAVAQLVTLAGDCRTILGATPKIGYAADWSEYHSYRPADGSGDVWFNLDPLWSNANIDFIGIDNYLPIADWRDGSAHVDYNAAGATTIYDPAYLGANIEGGEYFDWYYASPANREAQNRSLIADGVYGTPWLYRQKDIRSWWATTHRNLPGGLRDNLLIASGDPRDASWSDSAVTSANSAVAFGPFVRAKQITGTGSVFGVRQTGSVAITGGAAYRVVAWLAAGTSGRARVRCNCGPAALVASVVSGTMAAPAITATAAGNITGLVATDLGGGKWRWEFIFTANADRTTLSVGAGPDSATSGETVIVLGVDAARSLATDASSTNYVRSTKPIWFTELGCAAIDKGANQPNAFLDAASSESAVPPYSNGARDDAMQRAYLEEHLNHWAGDAMIGRILIWAWDARPSPAFGQDASLWADTANWQRGHWISGRLGAAPARETVRDIFARAGFAAGQIDPIGSVVDAVVAGSIASPRTMLEALAPVHQVQVVESGAVVRVSRWAGQPVRATVDLGDLVRLEGNPDDMTRKRAQETDLPRVLNVTWSEPTADDQQASYAAQRSGTTSTRTAAQTLPVVMPAEKGKATAETLLREAWTGRETLSLTLPPSLLKLEPGDLFALSGEQNAWRIEEIGDGGARSVSARRTDPDASPLLATPANAAFRTRAGNTILRAGRPTLLMIDGPLLADTDAPVAAHVLARAQPWGDGVAIYRSASTTGFALDTVLGTPGGVGALVSALPPGILWRWDMASVLEVSIPGRVLSSVDDLSVCNGANMLAVEQTSGEWEILQFATAVLIAPQTYRLTRLLRGQRGSEQAMGPLAAPVGAAVAVLDAAVLRTATGTDLKDVTLNWRYGPARLDVADLSFREQSFTLRGRGLRPFAPVHFLGTRAFGATDWQVSWIRRTRFGGDSWSLVEVPLNEDAEAYVFEVLDVTATTVLRSVALATPAFTYTAAMQTADFGAVQATFNARVVQISTAFGRGLAATALIGA